MEGAGKNKILFLFLRFLPEHLDLIIEVLENFSQLENQKKQDYEKKITYFDYLLKWGL